MPPKRVDEFDVYEFHVTIAEEKGLYTAVGRDAKKQEIRRVAAKNLDEVRTEIRALLSQLSDNFVGYPGAINQFLRAFPGGFEDPFFFADERNYKLKAHDKAKTLLSNEAVSQAIAKGEFAKLADSARKVFINVIFPNEGMAFKSFVSIEKNAKAFAPLFYELLYGEDFDAAFDNMVSFLSPGGAAKWTIMTYWPFILNPEKHIFMKPEVAQECARRLGDGFDYESKPSSTIYRKYLEFSARLSNGIASLKPRDNIDVQTFMYAVGKSGFVRDGVARRDKWIAAQQNG